jgi:hypothetical protein
VDNLAGLRRVDDQPGAEVDADVSGGGHGAFRAGHEHQVAGPQLAQVRHGGAGVELFGCGAGQADPGRPVGLLHQT